MSNRPKIERTAAAGGRANREQMRERHAVDAIFNSDPTLNPFDGVEYTGDLEKDSQAEVEALQAAFTGRTDTFHDRAQREADRFQLATDTEFWFAVCFQSREQKEEFLRQMGWSDNGDKYLNGLDLATRQGISLPHVDLPKPKNISARLQRLAKNL